MYICTTKCIEGFNHAQKYMLVYPTCMWHNNISLTKKRPRKWFEFEWGNISTKNLMSPVMCKLKAPSGVLTR